MRREQLKIIRAGEEFRDPDVEVFRNVFSEDVRRDLDEHILAQHKREIEYSLTDPNGVEVPDVVQVALGNSRVSALAGSNVVITKRDDFLEPSDAFEAHRDLERFEGNPLVLCTLGGRAILWLLLGQPEEGGPMIKVECVPNTGVVVHNNLPHCVSPPLGAERYTVMFGGVDANWPSAVS